MNKGTILIISENTERNNVLVETIGKQFYILTATDEETAINRFLQSPVELVLFGADISAAVKAKLTKIFSAQQAGTLFMDDNPAANMVGEISNAIIRQQKENKPAFSFKDDALKNAGLNIEIQ